MSLFLGSGRSRRSNLRPKVVHTVSDNEAEDQDVDTGTSSVSCEGNKSSVHEFARKVRLEVGYVQYRLGVRWVQTPSSCKSGL